MSRSVVLRAALTLALSSTVAILSPVAALADTPTSVPTITSPIDGATVTNQTLTVSATSQAPSVLFALGGSYSDIVPVSGGSATTQFPLLGFSGVTTVEAYDCDTPVDGNLDCNVADFDAVSVTIDLTDPVITSPPDNKVVGSSVTVSVDAPAPGIRFFLDGSPVGSVLSAPLTKDVSLSGVNDGTHTITVEQCNANGTLCRGDTDSVHVIKDTKGPRFTDVDSSLGTVFPIKDNYKDAVKLSARVAEKSLETKVEIRKAGGPLVRTLNLGREDAGRLSVSWNGRKSNGDVVPKGKYLFRFVGTDVNGVVGKSGDKVVYVSGKKLVKKTVTKTVSAWGSKISKYAGACSSVVKVGSGTVGLRSNSKDNCTGDAAIAATQHAIKIGKAKRYGNLKISVYGEGVTKDAPTAIMYNVRKNGEAGGVTRIGGSKGWTAGDSVDLEKYLFDGGYVSWVILTGGGNSYNAIKFKVQYTVTVLQ